MVRVLSLLPGNRAIVDTTDLFRVALTDGDILDEFVEAKRAASLVEMFNGEHPAEQAVAVPYGELA